MLDIIKNKKQSPDFEIFVMYDSKVEAYGEPMYCINRHDMTRQILNTFKDPSQQNNRFLVNAEDFSLFKIGSYFKKSGQLESHNPEHIANMHDLRAISKNSGHEST